MTNRQKLEEQFIQQELDEQGLSGKLYGVQEPKIAFTKDKRRKVTINAYTLASIIRNAVPKSKRQSMLNFQLGKDKTLSIDLCTLEVLYFNDRTCEETYLDDVTFTEG